MQKITDAITFYDGLDILEIRLNTLAPYIDRFVICESPYDMVGREKPLYFADNKERFKDFNITHLIVHDHLDHMVGQYTINEKYNIEPFYYQMDYMLRTMDDLNDEDIVFVSDFDEIPNMEIYEGQEGVFRQVLYYYYLDVAVVGYDTWAGTVASKRKNFTKLSKLHRARCFNRALRNSIFNGGWHFSYIGTPDSIRNKVESFCIQKYNIDSIKNNIESNVKNLRDLFGRRLKFKIEEPTGPKWLLENKDRYSHLFYGKV